MTTRVIAWDWRGQPDINDLAKIISELSGGTIHVKDVDTDCDEYAIAISTEQLTKEEAQKAYFVRWDEES